MTEESYISSIIIQAKSSDLESIATHLSIQTHLDIAAVDKAANKIIVVIDVPSSELTQHIIEDIKTFDGVYSVAMVYNHVEQAHFLDEETQ